VRLAAIGGTIALGVAGVVYGGALMAGAFTAAPGVATAVAVDGAAVAEGVVTTATGLKAVQSGRSMMEANKSGAAAESGPATETPRSSIKRPASKDPDLNNILEQLFRQSDRVPGGTAGAVRNEYNTSLPTGGKFHLQKAQDSIRALNRILKRADLDPVDRATAEAVVKDLQNAVNLATANK
jgi:hypothetical protein